MKVFIDSMQSPRIHLFEKGSSNNDFCNHILRNSKGILNLEQKESLCSLESFTFVLIHHVNGS